MNKTCSYCGITKTIDLFQKRSASKDGRTSSCKKCLNDRDNKRYQKEKEYRLERHKIYIKTENGKLSHKRAIDKWRSENQNKRAANVIVGNAVRNGKLIKPDKCSKCENTENIHAHHEDYSKPLDIEWLCIKCHNVRHKQQSF